MFLKYYKNTARYLLPAVFLIIIDRFLKVAAANHEFSFNIIGNLFKFNFVENYNIAFSLPLSGIGLIIIILLIVMGLFVVFFRSLVKNRYNEAGVLIFLLLGALSNLFDRVRYGFVVDYLDLKYFTVFNIADTMIVCSVIFLIFLNIKKDGQTDHL